MKIYTNLLIKKDVPTNSERSKKERWVKEETDRPAHMTTAQAGITCTLPTMTITKSEATAQLILIVSQFHPHAILIFPLPPYSRKKDATYVSGCFNL